MNLQRFNQLLRLGVAPQMADEASSLWKGDSGGKQKSTATSTPTQSVEYKDLLNQSTGWLNGGGFDKDYGGSAGFDTVADMNQTQQGAVNGMVGVGSGVQDMLNTSGLSSLGNYLGAYDPNKTGVNSAINAANSNLDWNYGTQVAPQIRQGATDAGQFGSTRHGVAEGIATTQLMQQKANNAATMTYNDQQAYNQNQLGVLNNLSTISKGLNSGNALQYDAGTINQTQQQNEINGQLEKWAYENNVDLNDLLAYKNLISGDMGGTNVSVTKGSSGGGGGGALSAIGTVGGAVLGGMYGGPMGASAGASIGGSIGGAMG